MFDIKESTTMETGILSGEAALKSMQNEHTFLLDLLIRESIQNSSDATIENSLVFNVFYNVGKFRNDDFTPYLGTQSNQLVEQRLNERFSGKELTFLEIRDSKTTGLDGEILKSECTNDTKSNYLRLIYEMGKGQDHINAGGKWGYGKTVYYRLGVGIVIYYSRIKNENNEYESRLILTLIEDEQRTDALLRNEKNNSAGRAWWGEKNSVGDICPITNESIINDFLAIFGLKPFDDDQTGTSVIIPYIDEDSIMEEAKTGFKVSDEMINRCSFLNSMSLYLRYAIQKWYAPINNNFTLRNYGRKFLNAYVNGDIVKKEEMYPIFRVVQELYTTAYSKFVEKGYQSSLPIVCKEAFCNYKRSSQKCGIIAFLKIKLTDLQGEENLLPPNIYMNVADDGYDGIVSLYTRNLGMILNYEDNWFNTTKEFSISPEEILVTLFVPDNNAVITAGGVSINLGEYLRQREEADHMRWDDDPASMKIKCVGQIKKSVVTAVRKYFNPEQFEQHGESDMSEFASVLGERLFPLKKKAPRGGGGSGGSGGGVVRSEKKYNFITQGISITREGRIKVSYELELKERTSVVVKTKVSSDIAIDATKWSETIGTAYPLKVTNFIVSTKENENSYNVDEVNNEVIISGEKNKISGTFDIAASDKKLVFTIDCEEKKEGDN